VFFEPTQTPYDLRWRMLGTQVRVSPWFWLMSVFLGWSAMNVGGFPFLLAWVGCVFVSILVHEFGHVLMGRLFGSEGHIVLYSFGGLAVGSNALANRWQRIAVCFAGPGAGFVLLAGVLLVARNGIDFRPWPVFEGLPNVPPLAGEAIGDLIWINLGWGLLNLLPIWPLDGGQISRDLLSWVSPGNGIRAAYGLSILVAGSLAIHALLPKPLVPFLPARDQFVAILFGLLALNNFVALQAERSRPPWEQDREERTRSPWEQDKEDW
jgi:stage IV sporulation protein FB